MPAFEINDLTTQGLILDRKPYQLPPEAVTGAFNVRYEADGIARLGGKSQVFGTLTGDPLFLLPFLAPGAVWWLYASLNKVFALDGVTEYDITPSGMVAAAVAQDWNGAVLGGIPILNNGADVPQYWPTFAGGTDLADLTNWNAAWLAKTIGAFGPFLLALNVTKTATRYPHMVKWSHPANPGSLPPSWDETDPTMDAGEKDLEDTGSGEILAGLPLRGLFYVYKERSTWVIRLSGVPRFPLAFDTFSTTSGILSPRCVCSAKGGTMHVVATEDDFIFHRGDEPQSLLDKRARRTIFNQISTAARRSAFVFENPKKREVWFCYAEPGGSVPTRALIWNWEAGTGYGAVTEAGVGFIHAVAGTLVPDDEEWGEGSGEWDEDTTSWLLPSGSAVLVADAVNGKILQLDSGLTDDEGAFTSTITREALSITGRERDNDVVVDWRTRMLVTRLWLKVEGGPIRVRVGSQEKEDGAITWSEYQTFDPATQLWVDFSTQGLALSFEFSSTDSVSWKLLGYKPEIVGIGEF